MATFSFIMMSKGALFPQTNFTTIFVVELVLVTVKVIVTFFIPDAIIGAFSSPTFEAVKTTLLEVVVRSYMVAC
jgi:hypothetical protein